MLRALIVLFAAGAIVVAVAIGLASDDADSVPDEPVRVSVDAILDVTPRYLRKSVRVEGTVAPVDDKRFVLRGDRRTIVVRPEPGVLDAGTLERGKRVTVLGVVENFDRLQTSALADLVASGRHPALEQAPTAREDPFISADSVQG